jgi:hypothetical protein
VDRAYLNEQVRCTAVVDKAPNAARVLGIDGPLRLVPAGAACRSMDCMVTPKTSEKLVSHMKCQVGT